MAKKKNEEIVEELLEVENETILEEVEEPKTHTVTYGETWVSIAELYKGKQANKTYAEKLKTLNNNKTLSNKTVLLLP